MRLKTTQKRQLDEETKNPKHTEHSNEIKLCIHLSLSNSQTKINMKDPETPNTFAWLRTTEKRIQQKRFSKTQKESNNLLSDIE